jgi:hypothetical protein
VVSSLQVAFVLPCLTDTRYIIPFAITMHRLLPDIQQSFSIERWSSKYNGLSHHSNFIRCVEIVQQYCPWAAVATSDTTYDAVVQVETGASLQARKRISIQHGFDCAFLQDRLQNCDHYICGSEMMFKFASDVGMSNCELAPTPVPFWSADVPASSERAVTVFYPDVGDNELAAAVVDRLLASDFRAFVKQRKKHQQIRSAGEHVYDTLWYPPEGISLPLMSEFTVGFGSSAYTDLVPVGLNYINIDLHHASFPWNVFIHPVAPNYVRVCDRDDTLVAIETAIATMRYQRPIVASDEHIKQFLLKLVA